MTSVKIKERSKEDFTDEESGGRGRGRREGREGVVVEGSVLFNRMNHFASTTHLNTHLELIKVNQNCFQHLVVITTFYRLMRYNHSIKTLPNH